MNPYPLVCIRLVAFCFLVFGVFMFLREAVSHPLAMAYVRIIGPGQDPIPDFNSHDFVMMFWRASPALVGAILLFVSIPAARLVSLPDPAPTVFFAAVAVRLVLIISLCFVACNFLDNCFDYIWMRIRDRDESTGFPRRLAWSAFTSLLPLLPLAALWFASARIARRIARDEHTRNA